MTVVLVALPPDVVTTKLFVTVVGDVHALVVAVCAQNVKVSEVDAVTTAPDRVYFSAKSVATQEPPLAPGMLSVAVAGDVPGVAIVTAKGDVEHVPVPVLVTAALPKDQIVFPVTTPNPFWPWAAVLVKVKAAVASAKPPTIASMLTTLAI